MSDRALQSVLLDVTASGNRLIAVGERGHILISSDNGATWQQKPAPVSVTLTAVNFASLRVGWAAGHAGVVLNTEDGGETWHQQLDGHRAAGLVMAAVEARRPTGEGTERFEQDLAEAKMLQSDGADKPFMDLCFADRQHGFIVGAYNLIFSTEDGGQTWRPWMSHTDNPADHHLYRMVSVGDDLFIAGELGLLLRSTDRGNTFSAIPAPYEGSYFGLIGLKSGKLIAYGLRGHAFRSTDRGTTWTPVNTGLQAAITDAIELKDGTLLLITQSGQILASHDQAGSFSIVSMEATFPFSAAAQAQNGDLVLVGARGVKVVSARQLVHPADKISGVRK
jgi:photosystem II stability/assembly factor-like uncharacterized protein